MPRIARGKSQTNYFHAMVQGIEKRFIFDNPVDMKIYIGLLQKNAPRSNVNILAYCIMHNHAHILIAVKNTENMSKFFRCVNTSYAQLFNAKNNRVGYVFRDRFKSEPIFTVKQLYNTINYIHNNPVKANICENAQDYNFSSYNEYFENSKTINKRILNKYFQSFEIFKFPNNN